MKTWHVVWSFLLIFAYKSAFAQILPSNDTFFLKIDPAGTYLFVDALADKEHDPPLFPGDSANGPTQLDLMALYQNPNLDVKPGDILVLQRVGFYSHGSELLGFEDIIPDLGAVFSGPGGFMFPGALLPVAPFSTQPTLHRQIPTNIPYDFSIRGGEGTAVQIPEGASRLLFSPNDSFFGDNDDPNNDFGVWIQVRVFKPYRLVRQVFIDDQLQDEDLVNISPSKEDGCHSTNFSTAVVKIKCLKFLPGQTVGEPVSGCQIKGDINLGSFLGAHTSGHNQNTRPMGKFEPNIAQDFISIPQEGLNIKYIASEISGAYFVDFEGADPTGKHLPLKGFTFRTATKLQFIPFTGIKGLQFHELNSHLPNDMIWGQVSLYKELTAAINTYFSAANNDIEIGGPPTEKLFENPFDNDRISRIFSQGVSLRFGGLFDVSQNWSNRPGGHCGHRQGIEIDISLSAFNNEYKEKLKIYFANAVKDRELSMPVRNESPSEINADHWHIKLKE